VLVNNKFALFDSEDEDPLEVLQRTQDAVTQSKAAKENSNSAKSKVASKNARNAPSKSVKTEPSKQPVTKVLAQTQEQKTTVKTTQNAPPRFRDNVPGECKFRCGYR